jgi:predicted alpha/beta-hydrolase family hydrolase
VPAKRRSSERLVDTPQGPARVFRRDPDEPPCGVLVLGHGAGGGLQAGDLQAAATAGVRAGWRVILVEQPWHVAGRRVAVAPPRLDDAWLAVLADLRRRRSTGGGLVGPLVVGGRSAGARVACRTATSAGAAAAVCLAFPLHPPGRPEASRADELAGAGVPVVVVQGERDAFGGPGEINALGLEHVEVIPVTADHALRGAAAAVADGVRLALGRAAARAG